METPQTPKGAHQQITFFKSNNGRVGAAIKPGTGTSPISMDDNRAFIDSEIARIRLGLKKLGRYGHTDPGPH